MSYTKTAQIGSYIHTSLVLIIYINNTFWKVEQMIWYLYRNYFILFSYRDFEWLQ